jgi:hypothetical protein
LAITEKSLIDRRRKFAGKPFRTPLGGLPANLKRRLPSNRPAAFAGQLASRICRPIYFSIGQQDLTSKPWGSP